MIGFQLLTIGFIFGGLIAWVLLLLRRFKRIDLAGYFIVPIVMFCFGFALRFTGHQKFIDIGYFLTDGAFMAVYMSFAIAAILGQMKYWGE